MKKYLLPLLAMSIVLTSVVSCSNSQKKDKFENEKTSMASSSPVEMKVEMAEMKAKRNARMKEAWSIFDTMSVESQKKFISEQKKILDHRDSIQTARRAEIAKKWAGFDTMSIEHQVELVKERGVMPHADMGTAQHQHASQQHQHQHNKAQKKHQHGPNCGHAHMNDSKYKFKEMEHHHQ